MTDPTPTPALSPEDRAAMRERYQKVERPSDPYDDDAWNRYWGDPSPDILRLLDALDTAEAEVERLQAEAERVEAERLPAPAWDEAAAEQCGAWGGCSLPHGHNLGRADIPMNHRVPSATREEVADVEAERLPAPAWDEAAVIEDMARAANPRRFRDNYTPSRGFGETRSDDELRECAREVERHKMRNVLAAVRKNLPVKPSREDVARALYEHVRPGRDAWDRLPYKDDWRAQADAVLDLWLGRSEATVKSEALREARAKLVAEDNDGGDWWDSDGQRYCQPSEWLDARADRIDPDPGSCSII